MNERVEAERRRRVDLVALTLMNSNPQLRELKGKNPRKAMEDALPEAHAIVNRLEASGRAGAEAFLVTRTRELMLTPEFKALEQASGWSLAWRGADARAEEELGILRAS